MPFVNWINREVVSSKGYIGRCELQVCGVRGADTKYNIDIRINTHILVWNAFCTVLESILKSFPFPRTFGVSKEDTSIACTLEAMSNLGSKNVVCISYIHTEFLALGRKGDFVGVSWENFWQSHVYCLACNPLSQCATLTFKIRATHNADYTRQIRNRSLTFGVLVQGVSIWHNFGPHKHRSIWDRDEFFSFAQLNGMLHGCAFNA